MKRLKVTHRHSATDEARCWATELQTVIGSSPSCWKSANQKVNSHMERCYAVEKNLKTQSMLFLLDNSNMKYLFVSESSKEVLGYSNSEILQNEFHWIFTLFSESELAYKNELMNDVFSFIKKLTPAVISSCVVRYDLVVRKKNKELVHLLEELTFPEVNDKCEPLVTTCFIHVIDGYGSNNERKCTIGRFKDGNEVLFSKIYTINKRCPLSDREIEILELFSVGSTTIQVAKTLHLSPNTIKAHRTNIFSKLSARKTAEAIAICIKNGWLP